MNVNDAKYITRRYHRVSNRHVQTLRDFEKRYRKLTDAQKRKMQPVIQGIVKTQELGRAVLNPLTKKLCPECRNCCCRELEGYSKFEDFVIWKEIKFSVPKELKINIKGNHMLCGFLGSSGCVFPDNARPNTCFEHLCVWLNEKIYKTKQRTKFSKVMKNYYQLRGKLNDMIYEFEHKVDVNAKLGEG